jgi:RIO-like serine/threonine protein kinase
MSLGCVHPLQVTLGSGAQGTVYSASTISGSLVAVKISRQDNPHTERELMAVRGPPSPAHSFMYLHM